MSKKILFVCTGNTFRSASAEYLFKAFLAQHQDNSFIVSSAGTRGNPYGVYRETEQRVKSHGGDMSGHHYMVLDQDIVDNADLIICMAAHHQEFVKKHFGAKSFLFNELAYGKSTDLKDDDEAYGEYEDLGDFIYETVDTIWEGLPVLYEKIQSMDL
ncbi:MAG: hypothetical protein KC535_00775 [Nanoarchaeota archaeon]|nr:hypothetical protein [Nanoarchaeota archaeon]